MRAPAFFSSFASLVFVAVLVLWGGLAARSGEPVPGTEDPPAHDPRPQLGGAREAWQGEIQVLRERVALLEAAVETLERQNKELAALIDPVRDVLPLLAEARPNLLAARGAANEVAAIATLRNLCSAQAQVQASARIDRDQDGNGEYGGFREMSGAVAGRMGSALVPPVLSSAFRTLNRYGEAERSGYCFKLYLPDGRGTGVGEPPQGFGPSDPIDSDLAETTWCLYAWPKEAGKGAHRTFFTNQEGDVLATEDPRYVGPGRGPPAEAAFLAGAISARTAHGEPGGDGNTWRRVN